MSETDKDDATSADNLPDADFPAEDHADDAPAEPEPQPAKARGGASATVAWLALFLALAAVATSGYQLFERLRAESARAEDAASLAALNTELDEVADDVADLSGSLDGLTQADAAAAGRLDALASELEQRASLFDSLPPRMSSLERSVAALQGVSIDARNTYLLAEAEYYLQIANAQLQLAGNPTLASLALEQADDRLLQLGDPGLTDVRRAIANELAALAVMQKPDLAGATLTLASLARVAESLPLRRPQAEVDAEAAAAEESASGAGRAWGAVKGAFSGLVRHTPPTDDRLPPLTPDAEPLIRSNLALTLQAARLAMLRGEEAIFEQSLDDADAWLATWFDTGSEAVAGTRETLAEIRDEYSQVTPPDISGSLTLLRQYRALNDADQ